jgi:hypothetical protein
VCELGVPFRIHSSRGKENLYMIFERIECYLQNAQ